MKKFTEQEIKDALSRAPKLVQTEISAGEETAVVIAQLGQKYKLHVDQIGTLAELNRNMLLGLTGPQEFLQELIGVDVPEETAKEIMTEINQKIFIPLRDQLRRQGSEPEAPAPQPKAAPQPARAQPLTPKPVSPQPPAYGMRQAPVPTPAPRPPSLNRLAQSAPARAPQSSPQPAQRAGLAAAIERATQAVPAPPPAPIAPSQPTPEPMKEVVRSAPVSLQPQTPPVHRPYSVDPYREPTEEDGGQ